MRKEIRLSNSVSDNSVHFIDGEVEAQVPASLRARIRTLAPSHDQGVCFTLSLWAWRQRLELGGRGLGN